MEFSEVLNRYMDKIHCNARDLAQMSGLSDATINQFRSGERIPQFDSYEYNCLIGALERVASRAELTDFNIRGELYEAATLSGEDSESFSARLTALVTTLDINRPDLAAQAGKHVTFLSHAIDGHMSADEYLRLATSVGFAVSKSCTTPSDRSKLAKLLKADVSTFSDKYTCCDAVTAWLLEHVEGTEDLLMSTDDSVKSFLFSLDEFDLDEYLKQTGYKKIKPHFLPFVSTHAKSYIGIAGLRAAEMEFLKRTLASKSSDQVWVYCDFSISDLEDDEDYARRFLLSLIMLINAGRHIHVIMDLNRPFSDLMKDMTGCIAMFMTGLLHPYYLDEPGSPFYSYFFRHSAACTVAGETLMGDIGSSFCTLGSDPEYYNMGAKRKNVLFGHALPLFELYTEDKRNEFEALKRQLDGAYEAETIDSLDGRAFKNMTITKYGDICITITKIKNPAIDIVIRHPIIISVLSRL